MIASQLFPVEQSERTSDDYLTPKWVFDTMGIEFDLDVASPPWATHVPTARKFTKADDGLSQQWEGRVWMNPPWSAPAAWVERFIEHGDGVAVLPWSKSQWSIRLWGESDAIALPGSWHKWDGDESIFISWFFAAFGPECVEAIGRLGRVR